jgi:endonuclease/exonuclease/phosphatase family metal-dependent hydrolase
LDTAIHGAFGTYDIAWQQNLPALLLTILTVLIQWLLLAGSSTTRQPANTEEDTDPGMKPVPWLAIGPFLFLQLVVFSNMARMAALTGWPLPFDFAWTLLAQLTALVVAAWLLSMKLRYPWLIALVSGGILVAVSVFPYPQEAWLVALTLFVGQVSLSTLMLIVIAGTVGQNSGARSSSVTVANGAGMLLLVVFLLGYYAVYQLSLPYSNTILELVAAVAVAACGLASCRTIKEWSAPGHAVWVAPLLALFLLILPMTGILTWQEAETTTGDGFPVRIMTYNLHNGFDTDGHLDMEALAQVIEESQPDIVVLQEISRGWVINGRLDMLTWLSQRLNMPYVSGPTADPLWGNAILSRYPIIESSNLELPPRDLFILRGFTSAVVDLGNGDRLQVIATHFHHLEQDSDVRQLQTPVIVDFWNNTERTVILGDLNAEPDAPEIDLLRKAGLVDAMADAEPVSAYTFHSADLYQRIDYIWVSPDLVVKEANVPFSKASDHLPVVVLIDK